MRGIMQVAALLALGAMLDWWLYDGFYTQGFMRMVHDIGLHMHIV